MVSGVGSVCRGLGVRDLVPNLVQPRHSVETWASPSLSETLCSGLYKRGLLREPFQPLGARRTTCVERHQWRLLIIVIVTVVITVSLLGFSSVL